MYFKWGENLEIYISEYLYDILSRGASGFVGGGQ